MRIEDRLRQILPRATAHEEPSGDLLTRIQAGIARRRRRILVERAAGAIGAVLFGAAIVWAALQPHGEPVNRPDHKQHRASAVVLSGFDWSGAGGVWKAFFQIRNRSAKPVGATVICYLEDANGHLSKPGTITLRRIRPGREVSTFVGIPKFMAEPTAQHCEARVLPPRAPQPRVIVAPHLVLYRVAFWTPQRGVAIGRMEANPCLGRCVAALAVTDDGGKQWTVMRRGGSIWRGSPTVLGTMDAWVSFGCRAPSCLIHTADGGRSWTPIEHNEPVTSSMFTSSQLGFGIGRVSTPLEATLLRTSDGGRTWQRLANPCPQVAYQPVSVWFISPRTGWLACAGEAATADQRFKAMLATSDGGRSWTNLHAEGLSYPGEPAPIQFFDRLHGCLWMGSGNPGCTDDGGRSWRSFDVPGFSLLDSDARGWFVNGQIGYSLNYLGGTLTLARTQDGGRTWRVVRKWAPHY
jgi:photosystem II stability/assembly factor-like uncharacterized protein